MNKLSEDLLFLFMDAMPTMAWYANLEGICTYVNKSFTEYTGFVAEDLAGEKWTKSGLLHPDDVQRNLLRWTTCVNKQCNSSINYRIRHKSGNYRWVRCSAVFIKDREDNPVAWFGTIEDIHDKKIGIHNAIGSLEETSYQLEMIKQDSTA